MPDDDSNQRAPEDDKFRPEAIAARIDKIGEEDDAARIAREEEQKLLARKRAQNKGKTGLQKSASRRLSKIGEGAEVKRPGLAADAVAPDADPLLERAARASKWIREHRQTFGGFVAIGVLAIGGFVGWQYWQDKRNAAASLLLAQAGAAEHGRVSESDDDDDDSKSKPLYPTFKTTADRRAAAMAKYREIESKYAGSGAAILARLAEGSLMLDQPDPKGALAAFADVKSSALAQADVEVRGRAIEGAGFAHELVAQSDEANAAKHLDDALSAFKQLESVAGFKELGMYHQARVHEAKGDKARAIELLKGVHDKVAAPGDTHPFSYLEFVVDDRLRSLDPAALPPKAPKMAGPAGDIDTSDPNVQERIRKMLEQMQKGGGGGGAPAPAGSQ